MRDLTGIATADGNILLFNVHLSSNPNAKTAAFPDNSSQLPDQYSQVLFNGASMLTPFMRSVAAEHGFALGEGAKGFVLNADLVLVI